MAKCPTCDAEVSLTEDVEQNEIVACSDCGAELEVKSVNPVELQVAPQEQEDWGE